MPWSVVTSSRLSLSTNWNVSGFKMVTSTSLKLLNHICLFTFVSFIVAGYNNLEVAEYLLEHGADVNAQDKGGLIPLHNAASYGVSSSSEHHTDWLVVFKHVVFPVVGSKILIEMCWIVDLVSVEPLRVRCGFGFCLSASQKCSFLFLLCVISVKSTIWKQDQNLNKISALTRFLLPR